MPAIRNSVTNTASPQSSSRSCEWIGTRAEAAEHSATAVSTAAAKENARIISRNAHTVGRPTAGQPELSKRRPPRFVRTSRSGTRRL
jgi:hypothetical protein